MRSALAVLLVFHGSMSLLAQETPADLSAKIFELPDVTVSAEDPLYLATPAAVGWQMKPIGQPPLDRVILEGRIYPPQTVEVFNISLTPARGDAATFSAVRRLLSDTGTSSLALPAAPGEPAGAGAPHSLAELAADVVYVPMGALMADLEVGRRIGRAYFTSSGTFSLADELLIKKQDSPSYAQIGVGFMRPPEPLEWSLGVNTAAFFLPFSFPAYMLNAGSRFGSSGDRFRFLSSTSLQGESWEGGAEQAGLLIEELSLSTYGNALGFYSSATAAARAQASPPSLAAGALMSLGAQWLARFLPLRLAAGGSVLYYRDELQAYPEGELDFQLLPALALFARAGPYLEAPASFLFRAVNSWAGLPVLQEQGGFSAAAGLLLDMPDRGSARAALAAVVGDRHRVKDGVLRFEKASQADLSAEVRWRLLQQVTVHGHLAAGVPLPLPANPLNELVSRSLGAGLELDFSKIPLRLILEAHWGDFPADARQSLITENLKIFSGWMVSLAAVWAAHPRNGLRLGLELQQPEGSHTLKAMMLLGYVAEKAEE